MVITNVATTLSPLIKPQLPHSMHSLVNKALISINLDIEFSMRAVKEPSCVRYGHRNR